jgi:hypothetical protein
MEENISITLVNTALGAVLLMMVVNLELIYLEVSRWCKLRRVVLIGMFNGAC